MKKHWDIWFWNVLLFSTLPIGHLQVIAKMTSSSCQADLGWDCSNCYRFTSFFSWFMPPIPKYVNSTLIYLERSWQSQSIIIGHFSCRWKILWLIRFSASKGTCHLRFSGIRPFQILSVTLTFLVSQLFLALKRDSPSVSAFQLQHFAW